MRYGLLDLAGCQQCHSALTSIAFVERESEMPQGLQPPALRVPSGQGVGLLPVSAPDTPLNAALRRHALAAADPGRNFTVEIDEGLLVCGNCGRWYPIAGQLPEILPDHLRDWPRDRAFFDSIRGRLPPDVRDLLESFRPAAAAAPDEGAHYKSAEMSITSKVKDPLFFGPGYSVPFNLWNPEFSLFMVSVFGAVVSVLNPNRKQTVIDSGCGYAWTSEWLHRAGLRVIGIDIARVYLEIAVARMGASRPHLIVADIEHLPLQSKSADAVVAYESFHHIPDRKRAMAGYDRALRPGGRVVLAEPDGQHETSAVAVDTMEKFGILERGMEIDDVLGYVEGTELTRVEQVYVPRLTATDAGREFSPAFLRKRRLFDANIFLISRGGISEKVSILHSRRYDLWPAFKHRVKRALGLVPGQ